jgi:hypothetical protein
VHRCRAANTLAPQLRAKAQRASRADCDPAMAGAALPYHALACVEAACAAENASDPSRSANVQRGEVCVDEARPLRRSIASNAAHAATKITPRHRVRSSASGQLAAVDVSAIV